MLLLGDHRRSSLRDARYKIVLMPDIASQAGEVALHGSVLVLLQFDVCEAIRLDNLQEMIRARTVEPPSLKQPAPGYIRYQRPPVVERLEPLVRKCPDLIAQRAEAGNVGRSSSGDVGCGPDIHLILGHQNDV